MLQALPALGGALGAITGGGVGQMVDSPRKMLWKALGLPDTGSQLVSNASKAIMSPFGMEGLDPENPFAKVLGMGAEMAGDPLTMVGMAGGAVGGLNRMHGAQAAMAGREAMGAQKASQMADAALGAERLAQESRLGEYGGAMREFGASQMPGHGELPALDRMASLPGYQKRGLMPAAGPDQYPMLHYNRQPGPDIMEALMQSGLGGPGPEGGMNVIARLAGQAGSHSQRPVGAGIVTGRGGANAVRGLSPDMPYMPQPGRTQYLDLLQGRAEAAQRDFGQAINRQTLAEQKLMTPWEQAMVAGSLGTGAGVGWSMFNQGQ